MGVGVVRGVVLPFIIVDGSYNVFFFFFFGRQILFPSLLIILHPSQEKQQRTNLCLGSVKTLDCCDSEAYSIQGSVPKMLLLLSLRRSTGFQNSIVSAC